MPPPPPRAARSPSFAAWSILVVSLLFSTFVRIRSLDIPLERDEGEFAYSARLILQGEPPYKHAYNIKLPGVDLVYAGFLATFGDDARSIHVGLLLANLATIVVLWRLANKLLEPLAAGAAACGYAFLSTSPSVLGMAAHATHFIALFTVLGIAAAHRAVARESVPAAFGAGLAFGTALLMKQPAAVFALLGLGMLVAPWARAARHSAPAAGHRLSRVAALAAYATGVVIPYAGIVLWVASHGVLGLFWEWTVVRARTWGGGIPLTDVFPIFWFGASSAIGPTWPTWAVAAVGLGAMVGARRFPAETRSTVLAWLAVAFLATAAGFFFRNHYFIMMLPAVSLCFGAGAQVLAIGIERLVGPRAAPAAYSLVAVVLLAVGSQAWLLWPFYFRLTPVEACRAIYGGNPFVESPAVGEYLRTHTRPDERIAVLGSEAQIYFYARRPAATGHLFVYPMMTPGPNGDRSQQEMIEEICDSKPAYIVYVIVSTSWLKQPESSTRLLRWAWEYTDAFYSIDGVIDIIPGKTVFVWGDEAAAYKGRSTCQLHVYKRKADPEIEARPPSGD